MKKGIVVRFMAAALAAATILAGCSETPAEKKPLALLLAQEDEFLLELKAAVEAEAAAQGYEVLYYTAEGDADTQIRQMHEAYAAGAGTLLVNLTMDQVAEDISKTAGEGGVVLINRAPKDRSVLNDRLVFVGCDEAQCGRLQGEALAAYFAGREGTEIRYLMFQGVPGLENTDSRTDQAVQALHDAGFLAVAAEAYQVCNFYRDQAEAAMERLLAQNLDYDCILCNNDAMALGVIEAMEKAGLDASQVPITGMDNTADGAEALAQGKLFMTVDQDAQEQAAAAVAVAINLDQGRDFDAGISIPKDQNGGNLQPYIFRTPVRALPGGR